MMRQLLLLNKNRMMGDKNETPVTHTHVVHVCLCVFVWVF